MGSLTALLAVSDAIERRDPYARGHSARVTAFARVVAVRLGCDEERLSALAVGGPLHDLGKLAVTEAVLLKPGPLSEAELAEIRAHPAVGARLIERTGAFGSALPCVLYHHERWDGSGYPTRAARAEIPLEARILAVADAFDAMTSTRPYRRALPVRQALDEVERCAGTQFDPQVARGFLEAWDAGEINGPALRAGLRAAASSVARGRHTLGTFRVPHVRLSELR